MVGSRRTASSLQLVCHLLLTSYFRVQHSQNSAIQPILCRLGTDMCPPVGTLQAQPSRYGSQRFKKRSLTERSTN